MTISYANNNGEVAGELKELKSKTLCYRCNRPWMYIYPTPGYHYKTEICSNKACNLHIWPPGWVEATTTPAVSSNKKKVEGFRTGRRG